MSLIIMSVPIGYIIDIPIVRAYFPMSVTNVK